MPWERDVSMARLTRYRIGGPTPRFAEAADRDINPEGDDETNADGWVWYTREDLRNDDEVTSEVVEIGLEAIETVETRAE